MSAAGPTGDGPIIGSDAGRERLQVRLGARVLSHVRTLVTLVVLAVILLVGLGVGFAALTQPVPPLTSSATTAVCTDRDVARGVSITPAQVTVNVLNAGRRDGLAAQTMDDLTGDGFDEGSLANAPARARIDAVQVWTTDPGAPAARLLAGYLGKDVTIVRRDAGTPGLSVVVGDKFTGVVAGRVSLRARSDTVVCGP